MQRRSLLLVAFGFASCVKGPALPELGSVPPFEFTDQDGNRFSSDKLKDKIWVADFFFTSCPGPCPRMSNQLRQMQADMASLANLRFVSITVDPENDTPATLTQYARRYEANPARWTFLTGRKDLILNLMSESMYLGHADTMTQHSTRFVLIDGNMKIRGYYDSFAKDGIEKLTEDIRKLHDRT